MFLKLAYGNEGTPNYTKSNNYMRFARERGLIVAPGLISTLGIV